MKARRYPGCRIALVAATFSDARDTMVEGESGLLASLDRGELRGGEQDGAWNRSLGELYLANGSRFKTFSSEKPWKLRGPQFHFTWGDEAAFWADASKGVAQDTTWSNLVIATRLPPRPGWDAEYRTQVCIATTPRPVALLRTSDPDPARAGLMQRPSTVITHGRTADNLANLSDTYKAQVIAPLQGTRLERQELDAELLDDVENALWTRALLDSIQVDEIPGVLDGLLRAVPGHGRRRPRGRHRRRRRAGLHRRRDRAGPPAVRGRVVGRQDRPGAVPPQGRRTPPAGGTAPWSWRRTTAART